MQFPLREKKKRRSRSTEGEFQATVSHQEEKFKPLKKTRSVMDPNQGIKFAPSRKRTLLPYVSIWDWVPKSSSENDIFKSVSSMPKFSRRGELMVSYVGDITP